MHRSIYPHELDKTDLSHFRVIQVSDGVQNVVIWEDPPPLPSLHASARTIETADDAATLTIRVSNPLDAGRRRDICEHLRPRIAARCNPSRSDTRAAGRTATVRDHAEELAL